MILQWYLFTLDHLEASQHKAPGEPFITASTEDTALFKSRLFLFLNMQSDMAPWTLNLIHSSRSACAFKVSRPVAILGELDVDSAVSI